MAFAVLVVATVGAFFLTQHLKVGAPLVFSDYQQAPAAFNPVKGRVCTNVKGQPLDYRSTYLTFSVGHTDSVGVYIVSTRDPNGNTLATLSSGTQMTAGYFRFKTFTWNGRLGRHSDGPVAPQGTYLFRIVFQQEGRSVNLSAAPVQVIRRFPMPRILSVTLVSARAGSTTTTSTATNSTVTSGAKAAGATPGTAVLSPPMGGTVNIRFTRAVYRRVKIDVYRTDVAGKPPRVEQFAVNPTKDTATWNGEIGGKPAPAGTYLIGITAQDAACDQVTYPAARKTPTGVRLLRPAPHTTDGSGVTVRYLTVRPPLTPVKAGSKATVSVYSPHSSFTWKLRNTATGKVVGRGSGEEGSVKLSVRLPKAVAGLYVLVIDADGRLDGVPLVAYATGRAGDTARVLVVLPMLDWVGQSLVDDSGDGLPDTLSAGDAVTLDRPLIAGSSADSPLTLIRDDAALLRYLHSQHLRYQLTTDLALSEQEGPSLVDRWGVLLPDGSAYLPTSGSRKYALPARLVDFVKGGGRVLALGTGALAGTSTVSGADARAAAPVRTRTDIFGAQRGPVASTDGDLITDLADPLRLFTDLPAITGFSRYQPIEPPAGVLVSAMGIAERSAAIVAFPDGSGRVIEIGLPNFGASLANNVDSQELMSSVWPLLAKQR